MHCQRSSKFVFLTSCTTGLMSKATKNISEAVCGQPLRDRTKSVSVTGTVGLSLAVLTLLLRVISRTRSKQFGMDDWIMVLAMVCQTKYSQCISLQDTGTCGSTFCALCCPYVRISQDVLYLLRKIVANYGLGRDIWTIPFENITYILQVRICILKGSYTG